MPRRVRSSDRFVLGLALIATVGLAARVAYVLATRDLSIKSDGVHYGYAAGMLVDGKGFVNPLRTYIDGASVPDATHPPGWTLVLAAITAAGFRSTLAYQLTAAAVGAAAVFMTGLAAREAFGRRVGLIAAGLACVYPGIWLYERELVSEPLALLGVATMIWLAYRFRAAPGPGRAIALGVVLGLSALTRSELVLAGLLVVTPIVLTARRVPLARRSGWLALAGVATAIVIAPWSAYNSARFAQPVPLSVGLGATMQAGNCAPTFEGDQIGYYSSACVFLINGIDPDPSIADGQYRANALTFITEHRARFVTVAAVRVARTFSVYDPLGQRSLEAERGSPMWVLTLALVAYWALVPLAVWGAIVARRRHVPIFPLLGFVLITVLVVVPTIGAVRYRVPAEIPLVILAALGIDVVVTRRAPSTRSERDADAGPPAPDGVLDLRDQAFLAALDLGDRPASVEPRPSIVDAPLPPPSRSS